MKKYIWGIVQLLAVLALISCSQTAVNEDSGDQSSQTDATTSQESIAEVVPTAVPTAIPPTATAPPPTEIPPTPTEIPPTEEPFIEEEEGADEGEGNAAEAHENFLANTDIMERAYIETFDGEPDSPQPWHPDGWDVVVHSRDQETWYELEAMEAHHGPNCEGPDVTHTVTAYEQTLFTCRNHLMTSLYTTGYGLLYFAPNHMIDFSEGKAMISIDASTYRASNRDWWDIWITPYEDYTQIPLENSFPDLHGYAKNTIHIRMPDNPNTFYAEYLVDFEILSDEDSDNWAPYDYYFEPDKARRDTFVFEFEDNRIRFGMPEYDLWWVDKELPVPLEWDKAIVQIGHHSYNPEKACEFDGSCGPNTWHWDNLIIAPAVPFTIIPSNERYVEEDKETMTFRQPAPAGAEIRFTGIGEDLAASYDNGRTWIEAIPVEVNVPEEELHPELFLSYRVAIPEGAQSVQFRGKGAWDGAIPWHVRNASIMSLETTGIVVEEPMPDLLSPSWQTLLEDQVCEA